MDFPLSCWPKHDLFVVFYQNTYINYGHNNSIIISWKVEGA